MMAEWVSYLLIVLGLVYTFFLPGFDLVETFFPRITKLEKIPLILLLSVLISTYWIYFWSLLFGYSTQSILISAVPFLVWAIFHRVSSQQQSGLKDLLKEHLGAIILSVILYLIFFLALLPAIFSFYHGYYVLSAVNWQDTAMHLSIMETISQGNFPPQAPYFSGHPLGYYYFIDFHSSILEVLSGKFFPQILILDNPFFIALFGLSVYCLSFKFFQDKKTALITTILACFFGNFMFINFVRDVVVLSSSIGFWEAFKNLLADRGYTSEFGKLMQVTPMADYFLQNRPMMIGLPAFVLTDLLLWEGFEQKDKRKIILAGFITGMLIKFQLFTLVACCLIFGLIFLISLKKRVIENSDNLVCFLFPLLLFLTLNNFLFHSDKSIFTIFGENLSIGIWDKSKDLFWYLSFYLTNFGIPFLLSICLFFIYLFYLFKKRSHDKLFIYLFGQMLILFLLPHLVRFTVYQFDMFKFFYFMIIPQSLIAGLLLSRVIKIKTLGPIVVGIVLVISSLNSAMALSWSYFNKYEGYSQQEYQAGLWIRKNTPQKAVFATLPTVHSPVSEIGGRLRVLSYTVWPYSHGFNSGEDNVFSRSADIDRLYSSPVKLDSFFYITKKYAIDYIYMGGEELNKYPQDLILFLQNKNLQLVYTSPNVTIFKVI